MPPKTPLLLLLDGILSQDEGQTRLATTQIVQLVPSLRREFPSLDDYGSSSTILSSLRSTERLTRVIGCLMDSYPHLASVASAHDGSLPLHFASSIGNVHVARLLLENFPSAASQPNSKGKIPLTYAAREGRTSMVDYLLSAVPETAQIQSKKRKLALHFAAGEGHTDVVKSLLRYHPEGASLTSGKGKLPLHFAARWGHLQTAHELCRVHPASVQSLDWEGSLPLHDAAREGQLEMAKFLVDRYPQGLCTANIRGEVPLFPAIRSGNVELVVYLLKCWPRGGKHILATVRAEDNVHEWDEQILTLCLRGAVENFSDCTLIKPEDVLQQRVAHYSLNDPNKRATVDSSSSLKFDHTKILSSVEKLKSFNSPHRSEEDENRPQTPPMLEITMPRSKSPILEGFRSRKKRTSTSSLEASGGKNKRSRCDFTGESEIDDQQDWKLPAVFSKPFYHLHAALECGASFHVVQHVLNLYRDQVQQRDGLGRYPLHLAVANTLICTKTCSIAEAVSQEEQEDSSVPQGTSDEMIDIVTKDILEPFPEASGMRDVYGCLPLHMALLSRADCRVIEALLKVKPSSGIEPCGVIDPPRFEKSLPIFMATDNDCDLATVYTLLRGDPGVIHTKG